MTGTRRPEQVTRPLGRLRRAGIEIIWADVREIDVAHRQVKTTDSQIAFDRLVIALGAELAPDALPGFTAGAHNVYTLDGAPRFRQGVADTVARDGAAGDGPAVIEGHAPASRSARPVWAVVDTPRGKRVLL